MYRRFFVTLVGCLAASAADAQSEPIPAGDVFRVNSYTSGVQHYPAVARNAAGDFVVVWDGRTAADSTGISAQRLGKDGLPAGFPIEVNTNTSGRQSVAAAAMHQDGSFVVVWHSHVDSFPFDIETIRLRRFAANGSPLDSEVQVNTYTTGGRKNPAVAMASDGGFIVVWDSAGSAGTDGSSTSIQARRYSAAGEAVGAEFQVNSVTTGPQTDPDVAITADDGFLVVWTSTPDLYSRIRGQRFGSDGSTSEPELEVTPVLSESFFGCAVATDEEGGAVVVWTTEDSLEGVGRRYSPDGTDLGYFLIAPGPTVLALGVGRRGHHVAVWTDPFWSSWGKAWDENGDLLHDEFRVPGNLEYAFDPDVAVDDDGGFIVVWSGYDSDIQARRYLGESIFSDGFESGDTLAWSSTGL